MYLIEVLKASGRPYHKRRFDCGGPYGEVPTDDRPAYAYPGPVTAQMKRSFEEVFGQPVRVVAMQEIIKS